MSHYNEGYMSSLHEVEIADSIYIYYLMPEPIVDMCMLIDTPTPTPTPTHTHTHTHTPCYLLLLDSMTQWI